MSTPANKVSCHQHGQVSGVMICQHLRDEIGLDMIRIEVPPDAEDYITLMCQACDDFFWEEESWSDALFDFADWKLFCQICAESVAVNHTLVHVGKLDFTDDE